MGFYKLTYVSKLFHELYYTILYPLSLQITSCFFTHDQSSSSKKTCRNPTNRDPTWSNCAATAHSRASQQHPSPATNSKVLGRKPGRVDFPSVAASTFKKTSKLPGLGDTAKQVGLGRITPGRMYGQYSLYLLLFTYTVCLFLSVFERICISMHQSIQTAVVTSLKPPAKPAKPAHTFQHSLGFSYPSPSLRRSASGTLQEGPKWPINFQCMETGKPWETYCHVKTGNIHINIPLCIPVVRVVPHLLPENIESLFSRSKAFCKIDGLAVHHNERLDNLKAIKMTLKPGYIHIIIFVSQLLRITSCSSCSMVI